MAPRDTSKCEMPKKGQVWKHGHLRGQWRVQSAGPKFVTLKSLMPHFPPQRIPTTGFRTAGWERVR